MPVMEKRKKRGMVNRSLISRTVGEKGGKEKKDNTNKYRRGRKEYPKIALIAHVQHVIRRGQGASTVTTLHFCEFLQQAYLQIYSRS